MKHVRVQTVCPLMWGGQSYQAGATLMVPVIEALRLKRQRLITTTKKAGSLTPPMPSTPPMPEPIATEAPSIANEYDPVFDVVTLDDTTSPPSEPEDPPKRRKYKRRDLEAEP